MKYKGWLITFMLSTSCSVVAQEVDSIFRKQGELSFNDSLTVFRLIDSLMTMESIESSQLAVRVGYNSNVLSAGRTLGIEQFGLSPGISYYHKSGLYADVSTYWSKDYDPNVYLTTTAIGYMHVFSGKFSAITSYDHYFYHQLDDDVFVPYTNAVTVSPFLDLKPFSFRLDYSFYFGDAYANRIMPGISVNLKKKNFMGFDRVSFYPSFYLLLGDETITEFEYVEPKTLREAIDNFRKYGMRYSIEITERNVFGIMNYAFTLPVNFSAKSWLFNLSYTYSIPKALDGEPLTLEESGFISASISFYIDLKRAKKLQL